MKVQYFKTYDQALQVAQTYAGQTFPNRYQYAGENSGAIIREFTKGFAIQFGDCGPYLEETS
jgi:hypothetical protein